MQTKAELEAFYTHPDPWGYQSREDDIVRRNYILNAFDLIPKMKTCLDIGCGEGFITCKIPLQVLGVDISENAIKRAIPAENVTYRAVNINDEDLGKFDVTLATGVFYPHFVTQETIDRLIGNTKFLITCHAREVGPITLDKEPVFTSDFPYDGMTEELRIYDCSTP